MATPGFTITSQSTTTALDAQAQPLTVVRVFFETAAGDRAHVDVPLVGFTAQKAKDAVAKLAAELNAART